VADGRRHAAAVEDLREQHARQMAFVRAAEAAAAQADRRTEEPGPPRVWAGCMCRCLGGLRTQAAPR